MCRVVDCRLCLPASRRSRGRSFPWMRSLMPCGPTGSHSRSGVADPGVPAAEAAAVSRGSHRSDAWPGLCARVGFGDVDAIEFERGVRAAIGAEPSVARARLHDALSLWRGAPYAGFEDVEPLRAEQVRLEEFHLQAIEAHAEALLACGDPNRAITELDAFVLEHPLRAEAQATLMRALAATGRDAEALRVFQAHRHHLVEELGLEPSPRLRRLEAAILRGDVAPAPESVALAGDHAGHRLSIDGLSLQRLTGDGIDLAWGELGVGSPVIVVPAWLSNLEVIAEGGDPRSSLIEHLARHRRAITYDRRGTGLSGARFAISASRPPSASSRPCWTISVNRLRSSRCRGRGQSRWRARPADPTGCLTSCCSGRTRAGPRRSVTSVDRSWTCCVSARTSRPSCWPVCTAQERRVPRRCTLRASCGRALPIGGGCGLPRGDLRHRCHRSRRGGSSAGTGVALPR